MVDRHMRALVIVLVAIALLAAACGGRGKQNSLLQNEIPTQVAAGDAPERTQLVTPTAVPTRSAPPGRVATNVTAVCRLGQTDAIIYVTYRAQAVGTEIHRMRLMVNNKVADDTGDIYETSFERVATVHVVSGKRYSLTVSVDAPNAFIPQIANIVGCPGNPGPAA